MKNILTPHSEEENSKPLSGQQIVCKIERALRHSQDTHSWEDIRRGLLQGNYQIFQNDHGAVITEIVQAPNKRYLNCFIVVGRLPGVMSLQKIVTDHARDNGCEFMLATSRLGWRKVLPLYGWREDGVIFRKDVPYA